MCIKVDKWNNSTNSCSYGNVNATSELQAKSAELCELTWPTFSDSRKQVPFHFIRDPHQYFNLRQTPEELRLPLVFRAIQEPFAKQWLSTSLDKLKGYDEFKKTFTELLWNYVITQDVRENHKREERKGRTWSQSLVRYLGCLFLCFNSVSYSWLGLLGDKALEHWNSELNNTILSVDIRCQVAENENDNE